MIEETSDEESGFSINVCTATCDRIKVNLGGWDNSEQGWDKAFAAFAMFDDVAAENFVSKILAPMLRERDQ